MTGRNVFNYVRALFILGRTSNLPTVWSNCFAGWILGYGGWELSEVGSWTEFFWLCSGASFLYLGGMFLNDAFDADFDSRYRSERPIPSGAIRKTHVWIWGIILLLSGTSILAWPGGNVAAFAGLLASFIVFYDVIHKYTALSPFIMAGCRFLLYLVAASMACETVSGLVVWSALVLAAYILGLSYIAKTESAPGPCSYWLSLLLIAPVVLAFFVNDGSYKRTGGMLSFLLILWVIWSLRPIFTGEYKKKGECVSRLLAGIVLVDLLAVGIVDVEFLMWMAGFFLAARILQRIIPAT